MFLHSELLFRRISFYGCIFWEHNIDDVVIKYFCSVEQLSFKYKIKKNRGCVFSLCWTSVFFIQLHLKSEKWSGSSKLREEWTDSMNGCLSIKSVSMVGKMSWFFSNFKENVHGEWLVQVNWQSKSLRSSRWWSHSLPWLLVNKWVWRSEMWVNVHIYMFQVGSAIGFPAVSPSRSVRHCGSGKAGKTAPPALWPGGSCWRPPARWLLQTACPLNDSSWTEYCGTQRPSRSFQLSCTVLSGLCSHIPVHCNPPRTTSCLQETDK